MSPRRALGADVAVRFAKDIDRHVMTILRDDGVNRHLRFKRPGSSTYWFDIITWGGRLYIGGDCGAWVFARLEDMFQFFRSERGGINPSYWSEKLEATPDKGAEEFSEDRFREVVNEYRLSWVRAAARDGSLTRAERRELWEAVADEVLNKIDRFDESLAFQAANDFTWKARSCRREWYFVDFWDHGFKQYTRQFLWNCHAIVWAIAQYDAAKKATVAAASTEGAA